jgi:hypothetical protein
MLGGYAGFFAFWAFMNGRTSDFLEASSGFFMAISLAAFIMHVVWSNLAIGSILSQRSSMLRRYKDDYLAFLAAREEFDNRIED